MIHLFRNSWRLAIAVLGQRIRAKAQQHLDGLRVLGFRRLVEGGASRSYGIQVAKLAGLPATVIEHARTILRALEADSRDEVLPESLDDAAAQLSLGMEDPSPRSSEEERDVLEALRATQPDRTTPLEALALLNDWVGRLSKEGDG